MFWLASFQKPTEGQHPLPVSYASWLWCVCSSDLQTMDHTYIYRWIFPLKKKQRSFIFWSLTWPPTSVTSLKCYTLLFLLTWASLAALHLLACLWQRPPAVCCWARRLKLFFRCFWSVWNNAVKTIRLKQNVKREPEIQNNDLKNPRSSAKLSVDPLLTFHRHLIHPEAISLTAFNLNVLPLLQHTNCSPQVNLLPVGAAHPHIIFNSLLFKMF